MRRAPYCRIVVFGERNAWNAHNPDPVMERAMARLPGDGAFYWATPRDAWRAARVIARDPGVDQIKVETISGRGVGRLFKDGHAYAYDGSER